jgi:hypothetical protein
MEPTMRGLMKRVAAWLGLYHPLRNWVVRRRQAKEYAAWDRAGRPVPPPHLAKQRVLLDLAERFDLRILVETGTFYGDMVEAMRDRFQRIYSIELSDALYEKARDRFRGVAAIEILHGDSGAVLGALVPRLDRPALFWLDGHYSAGETARGERDTPILQELSHIFEGPDRGHVIVIDDARHFGVDPAYPSLDALSRFVESKRSGSTITVEDDSIRITPGRAAQPRSGTAGRSGAR